MLHGKRILLGVSGGIAAYKTASLVRLFIKSGAEVKVVMTQAAKDFVSPLTLATLSQHPVYIDFVEQGSDTVSWNNHVELGKWCDLMIIAPATSNTLAKMVSGQCDNLLLATYLSCDSKAYVAPAMDLDMYAHPATKHSLDQLRSRGVGIIEAEIGFLASGLEGQGRMSEPEHIISFLEEDLRKESPLKGKQVLVSAGPTKEAIDPVRFISNESTGTMGYHIASELCKLGAEVVVISGPVSPFPLDPSIRVITVVSAKEMSEAVKTEFSTCHWFISAAAVADYTPLEVSSQKIKKSNQKSEIVLKLVKTEDILKSLSVLKTHQKVLGFALESEDEENNALQKFRSKALDGIALNSLRVKGAGFGTQTNELKLIFGEEDQVLLSLASKQEIAKKLCNELVNRWV